MAQGFIGNEPVKYFETIVDALERASSLSDVSFGDIPDGKTGGYSLPSMSSSNVVVKSAPYTTAVNFARAIDDHTAYELVDIINQLRDMCHTMFVLPATSAKVLRILDELSVLIRSFTDFTNNSGIIVSNFLSGMDGIDSADLLVYEHAKAVGHIADCEGEITRQLDALRRRRDELATSLASAELSRGRARSTIYGIESELTHSPSVRSGSSDIAIERRRNLQQRKSDLRIEISSLTVEIDSLNDRIKEIEEFEEELLEIKRTTSNDANSLLDSVRNEDGGYSRMLHDATEDIRYYKSLWQKVPNDIWTPDVAAMKFMLATAGGVDAFNSLIENLAILEDKYNEERLEILRIILNAPKPYRCLIFAFADRINIVDIYADIGSFTRATGEFRFNIINDRENRRGPFYTFFHELGHMIDFYINNPRGSCGTTPKGSMFSGERSEWAQLAYDAGRRDVEARLRALANEIAGTMNIPPAFEFGVEIDMTEIAANMAVTRIMRGNRIEEGQATTDIGRLQLELQEQMQELLNNDDDYTMRSVRDVFGGHTNEAVRGSNRRRRRVNPRYDYWFNDDGSSTYRQNSEFFADYFAHSARSPNDPLAVEALNNMVEWFPGQMEYMEKIMEDAASSIGG